MTARSEDVQDNPARARTQRLVDMMHELTADRPLVRHAIERCVHALVMDDRRRAIYARIERCPEEDLETVSALLVQLEANRREDTGGE